MRKLSRYFPLILILFCSQVWAFGDDLCFSKENKPDSAKVNNCILMANSCRDAKTDKLKDNFQCRAALVKDVSRLPKVMEGSRSMLHTDATYFIAQALGYSSQEAYQIVSYNQATDLGVYQPFDEKGHRLVMLTTCEQSNYTAPNCEYMSQNINGLVRLNFSSAGHTLHLPARYYQKDEVAAPLPFPYDYVKDREHELVIAHYYDWAFGKIPSVCVSGITQSGVKTDDTTAALCDHVQSFPADSRIDWRFPIQLEWDLIGIINKKRYSHVPLGEQILREYPDGKPQYYSRDLEKVVGKDNVKLAKLGVFLHLLQDRYSHHLCSDNSQIREDKPGQFSISYDDTHCKQGPHLLGHLWEIGMPQDDVPPEYRTMAPALAATYDILLEYGKTHNQLVKKPIALKKDFMVADLVAVLEMQDPTARLAAMTALFKRYKLQPLPGHGGS